jgi:hypothetical protein
MDVLKGFHQNVIAPDSGQYLRIICHKGIYKYLRMPFGIKKCPIPFPENDGHGIQEGTG